MEAGTIYSYSVIASKERAIPKMESPASQGWVRGDATDEERDKENGMRWLPFVPMIAGWIRRGMQIDEKELLILRNSYTHIYIFLADTSYWEMRRELHSYSGHPVYGGYVRTILSPEGEKWLSSVIEAIKDSA